MAITIEKLLDRIEGDFDGFKVTLLKDGAAKMFKRRAHTVHAPSLHCPDCSSALEHIKVVASSGRYVGKQMYCGCCDKPVHNFTENKVMLVAELDGVRCYFDGQSLLMTKKDLHV